MSRDRRRLLAAQAAGRAIVQLGRDQRAQPGAPTSTARRGAVDGCPLHSSAAPTLDIISITKQNADDPGAPGQRPTLTVTCAGAVLVYVDPSGGTP